MVEGTAPAATAAAAAAAGGDSRPTSSGRPTSAGSSGGGGGAKSKLSLKRKRTGDTTGASKPSTASTRSNQAEETSLASSTLKRKKGSTRRKKRVISGVFAARRQAREQAREQQAAAASGTGTGTGTGLTFPDEVAYKFGGGAGNKDESTSRKESGSSSGGGSKSTQNRSVNSDDDTDPCSSGAEENEFDWSQSQRQNQNQSQQQQTGNIEDGQDSMASAGSLQSAASSSTGGSNKQPAKRRKRNAIGTKSNRKPPIPSFSPVEWSSHGDDDDDAGIVEDDTREGGDKTGEIEQIKESSKTEKSTTKSKPRSKQKATKSIKRVGVGFGSPSSSSSSDEDGSSAVSKSKTANSNKKDEKSKKIGTAAKGFPDISDSDRAASAAARGDEALALVEAALAKSASTSASAMESAPAGPGNVSAPNVPSEPNSKADASATALDLSAAVKSVPADDNAEISAATIATDTPNISNAAATASASGSKEIAASKRWNCSACTLLNLPRKRKCKVCGSTRPPSDFTSQFKASDADAAVSKTVLVDVAVAKSESNTSPESGWNCQKCTLHNAARKRKCEACGKAKPVESPADGVGRKSPVIDLSLEDSEEKDKATDNGIQQNQKDQQVEATARKSKAVKETSTVPAKKQSGQDGGAKEISANTKKGKKTKAGKEEGAATTAAGTTKPKAAQKKRKRQQQPKKKAAAAAVSSPIDDDAFDIPVSKQISDKEKMLDRQHADLLRQLAKKPSPGKDSDGGDEAAPKRTKRGGAACALCSTCSCSRGSALKGLEEKAKLEAKNPMSKLARSDAEIERALLGRLARLEKSASWFDTLCYKVGRELKKHRNKVTKKRASLDGNSGGGGGGGGNEVDAKPRFLADADVDGQDKGMFYPRTKKSRVAKAHQGLFGTEPTVKETQPTLTQMMRGEDGNDESDDNDDTGKEQEQAPDVLLVVEAHAPEGMELEPLAEEEDEVVQNNDSARNTESDDLYVVGDGAANDLIIYEESEEGSPVEVRSPMADYHDASQRGLERASRNSQVGMWNTASSALSKRGAEVPDSLGIDDDFNRKVVAAIHDDSETGIDDLLELFQEGPTDIASASSTPSTENFKPPPEMQSQLTQRGQDALEELHDTIMSDPARREAIEVVCPNWQDSVRYPFLQSTSDNLKEAVENVRESRRQLQEARERILAALKQREEAFNLFEEAISSSMNRFAASTNDDNVPGSPDSCSEEKKSD